MTATGQKWGDRSTEFYFYREERPLFSVQPRRKRQDIARQSFGNSSGLLPDLRVITSTVVAEGVHYGHLERRVSTSNTRAHHTKEPKGAKNGLESKRSAKSLKDMYSSHCSILKSANIGQ